MKHFPVFVQGVTSVHGMISLTGMVGADGLFRHWNTMETVIKQNKMVNPRGVLHVEDPEKLSQSSKLSESLW